MSFFFFSPDTAWDTNDLATYVASCCLAGLMAAHERQGSRGQPRSVAHGHLSPRSVLVSHAGEIKLSSFGAAKASLSDDKLIAGIAAKTARYRPAGQTLDASPEPTTDLWAVGVILWELATGQRLPSPHAPEHASPPDEGGVVPDPATMNAGISPGLRELILTMLQPDATARYASARKALGALRSLADARDRSLELGSVMEWCYPREALASRRSSISRVKPAPPDDAAIGEDSSRVVPGGPTMSLPEDRRASSHAELDEPDSPEPPTVSLLDLRIAALLVAILAAGAGVSYLAWERLKTAPVPVASSVRAGEAPARARPRVDASSLEIVSTPAGAAVTLDGIATGQRTPVTLGVPAGAHRVQLRWPDGARARWSGSCAPGTTRRVSLSAPGSGAPPASR